MGKISSSSVKVLLLENIHPVAEKKFRDMGFSVDIDSSSKSEEDLIKILPNYQILGVRSKTQITQKILEKNSQLLSVGAFCIGTNQIDVKTANKLGIPVFNAPYSNTRSVAEMVLAQMISLSRNLGDRNIQAHQGVWNKSAKGCREVRGKTLGLVGYGHIGSQISVLAESLGLRVLYYDIEKKLPLGNAKPTQSLSELLKNSDFVSLHVPETPETINMIGSKEFEIMKTGAYLLNASRGSVVDIPSLVEALKKHKIGGVAIDVFPEEPQSNSESFSTPLQGLPNVILSPHIGGSTEEAQESIGNEVADSLLGFIGLGNTTWAVNFPKLDVREHPGASRLINIHKNIPGVLKNINKIVASAGSNIVSQQLATDSEIGYLVMDFMNGHEEVDSVYSSVSSLETSIKTRVLF